MTRTDQETYAPYAEARRIASAQASQRPRIEARRRAIGQRLPALQHAALASCPAGMIPRVGAGGILPQALRDLAAEFHVHPATIQKDIRVIEAQDLRRMDLAQRLPALREAAKALGATGEPPRLPKPMVYALGREYGVKGWTIRRDVEAIDRRMPRPRRKRVCEVSAPWLSSMALTRRLTVRMPEELYQALIATGDPVGVMRTAAQAYLNTGTNHTRDECALTIAQACDPDTQDRLVNTADRLSLPLAQVMTSLLLVRSKEASA